MKTHSLVKSLIVILGISFTLDAGIVNTKHNFSTTGGGTIKATAEQELCVFCHIPHSAQAGTAPLWNRTMHADSYNMYDSDYLRRLNYPIATSLGTASNTPGAMSRQCLSCHDGTVAIGSVYLIRGTLLGSSQIAMSGVNPNGTMPATAQGYLGTDLRGHHPVGYEYDPSKSVAFGSGTRTAELRNPPTAPIKLHEYPGYAGKKYIECTSCHDPHTENKKFLHVTGGTSHAANVVTTCIACHDKTMGGGPPTAHAAHGSPYFDTAVLAAYNNGGGVNVATMYCINCHSPHKGNGKPYILRQVEQNTCYMGAASARNVSPCHGTGTRAAGNDVESILARTYGHPVNTTDGVHTNLDTLYGTGNTRIDDTAGKGIKWSDSKHAECYDCHNPHRTGLNKHVDIATNWYPTTPSNSTGMAQGYALYAVNGVEPTWPTRWTQPTTFTTVEKSTKEYQICLKCHSYWGLGTAKPLRDGETNEPLSKHTGFFATDQGWEFNPYNRSAHPVVMSLNAMVAFGGNTIGGNGAIAGRYAPPLSATYLKSPWNVNPGNQTMMCSDCHGAEDETTSGVKGPHGSSRSYMLKGVNGYWPAGPGGSGVAGREGGNLYTINDIAAGGAAEIFCLNCHTPTNYPHKTSGGGSGGMKGLMCVECHVAIPHGSPVSRLVGYKTFPQPYNYSTDGTDAGRLMKIDGFFRQSSALGVYTSNSDNMWASTGCGGAGAGCHRTSPVAGITYDTYP